ncbi:PP2C family protein-serine/threonine phosphatase [Butyrivibrio sp. AE2032]|uniref:PP2C family protein-serine/threonine phosphatase n=1 Tax=Butyrivibrio sp. AE2032 TaxID=1458463 RepID=UPI00068CCFDB|nr:PP2C family protein-serine/threonine phosphatase [Butyrivibrio sp. AE2032]
MNNSVSEKREDKKTGKLSKKVMLSSILHSGVLGTVVLLISVGIFLYSILSSNYGDTVNIARTISAVLQKSGDVPGLVDAVLAQERENQNFEEEFEKNNPADTEGQLLNYRWYTEENPPLAKRQDYQRVMDIIATFNGNNPDLNGTCLMVFDKETHIASLLCDVEKFGGDESVIVDDVLWRRFEDIELDHIEEERWSLLKNLIRYMKIDPRYVVFAWYEPFPYPDENVIVFIEADAFYTNVWSNVLSFILIFLFLILVVVLIMGAIYRSKMQKMIVNPINSVADAARSYALDRKNDVKKTKYFSSLNLGTGDEIESLSDIMADMEKEIEIYEENLTRVTSEKERLSAELDVASTIQRDMLPQIFPVYPERSEFEVFANMDPAKEVGGDFYDIFMIDDDHLALVMADVSGKGIPAALFMVISKTLIKNRAMMGGNPAEIFEDVNNRLCEGNKSFMFVTVWLGILTISTGEVVEANAGHEDPFLLKKDGAGYEELTVDHDLVLGAMKNTKYNSDSFVMKPGEKLFIYTDGVPEATNSDGLRYEMPRLSKVLNDNIDAEPKELLKKVREDVDSFVGDADQFDDLTMLAFKYNGKQGPL